MQICSKCNHRSPDSADLCENCKADLREFSTRAVALKKIQANPRISNVIISVAGDACPACVAAQATYAKDEAPPLPIEGCSHAQGCRCFYQPVLETIYP